MKPKNKSELNQNKGINLAGILPYKFTPSEKEEVRKFIRAFHSQSENSIIVLDSFDLPEGLEDQLSFAYRDKDVTQSESRSLLAHARRYMASLPNPKV